MNLADLFERMHADRVRRLAQYAAGAVIALVLLAAGAWIDNDLQRTERRWVCFAERIETDPYVELVAYPLPDNTAHPKPGVKVACP